MKLRREAGDHSERSERERPPEQTTENVGRTKWDAFRDAYKSLTKIKYMIALGIVTIVMYYTLGSWSILGVAISLPVQFYLANKFIPIEGIVVDEFDGEHFSTYLVGSERYAKMSKKGLHSPITSKRGKPRQIALKCDFKNDEIEGSWISGLDIFAYHFNMQVFTKLQRFTQNLLDESGEATVLIREYGKAHARDVLTEYAEYKKDRDTYLPRIRNTEQPNDLIDRLKGDDGNDV